jgi:hypothetical protein
LSITSEDVVSDADEIQTETLLADETISTNPSTTQDGASARPDSSFIPEDDDPEVAVNIVS